MNKSEQEANALRPLLTYIERIEPFPTRGFKWYYEDELFGCWVYTENDLQDLYNLFKWGFLWALGEKYPLIQKLFKLRQRLRLYKGVVNEAINANR